MEPVKYIIDSIKKTKACTKDTNIPIAMIGIGAKKRPARPKRIPRTSSWPIMFPYRRNVRERTLAKWPMISIGKIIGVNHQTGPIKCLMYFTP